MIPVWKLSNVSIGNEVKQDIRVPIPASVRDNGTLFSHVFVYRTRPAGSSGLDVKRLVFLHLHLLRFNYSFRNVLQSGDVLYSRSAMTRHMPSLRKDRKLLLETDAAAAGKKEVDQAEVRCVALQKKQPTFECLANAYGFYRSHKLSCHI